MEHSRFILGQSVDRLTTQSIFESNILAMTDKETRKHSINYTSSEIELLFELAGKRRKYLTED